MTAAARHARRALAYRTMIPGRRAAVLHDALQYLLAEHDAHEARRAEPMYPTSLAEADSLQVDDVVVLARVYAYTTSHVAWWDGLLEVMGECEGTYPAWFRQTVHGVAHGALLAVPLVPADA